MTQASVNDLRLKIKKLKYKIQKQETFYEQLKQQHQQYRTICKTELSEKKIFRKINFLLQIKGMTISDWINAAAYENGDNQDQIKATELIGLLEKMGIRLQAGQKCLLLNFICSQMTGLINKNELLKYARQAGIRTSD